MGAVTPPLRKLSIIVLVLAIAVGLAWAMSSWQFVPRRSPGSILVGTTIVAASLAELILVPLLAYRFATLKHARSKRALLCLLAGIAGAVPAIGLILVAFRT